MENEEKKVGYGHPPAGKPFEPGQSGNPNGRPKGSRNFKNVIREMVEDENFDWSQVPLKPADLDRVRSLGSPSKAIILTAIAKSIAGDVKAMRFLQQGGYGDKLDPGDDKDVLILQPVVMPVIKKRYTAEEGEVVPDDGIEPDSKPTPTAEDNENPGETLT